MISVQPAQLTDWLASVQPETPAGRLPVVLDVREPWELQTASVNSDGFELIAMPMRSVPERYLELDQDHPIACLCHHGMRSAQVVHFLMQQGFTQTVNIHGGINAWSQERDTAVPLY